MLARITLHEALQQRFPTGSDELSHEEKAELSLIKRSGNNILGGEKNPWEGSEHLV